MENAWLAEIRVVLERVSGVPLELSREEIDELLQLASFVAHESGAKLNAPLACYLAGRAAEGGGLTVEEVASVVKAAPAQRA